ncbi:MAG: potassium transporter TrkG [Bowdeniella nasicola]|nr:potassium transporter TrkG [Bowdeniella nasicola]
MRTIGLSLRDWVDEMANSSPSRLALLVFTSIVLVVTTLLSLPIATASGQRAPLADALFTATSAVCVTGLVTVETASYWSTFGHVCIMLGAMIGGLGVMTLASILGFAVSRRIGLTQRLLAARETKTDRLGEVGSLIRAVVVASLSVEITLALVLFPRLWDLEGNAGQAAWHAAFMAASIFNNAGFVILPDGLAPHIGDWWICLPIAFGTALGAIGFPVLLNLRRHFFHPRQWSLHTKLTIVTYVSLCVLTFIAIPAMEWTNPATFGQMKPSEKFLSALVLSVNSRSSGLETVPIGHMRESTWFVQDALMFVGGGTASTGGGIKVTTLAVLVLAIVAEARGDRDIEAFRRRIPIETVRLAVAVAFIGATLVGIATLLLLSITSLQLDSVLFEVISAFGTVGLSTGITPHLPDAGKYVLTVMMFTGRVGTMTLAAALALRSRRRVIRMPAERPAVG